MVGGVRYPIDRLITNKNPNLALFPSFKSEFLMILFSLHFTIYSVPFIQLDVCVCTDACVRVMHACSIGVDSEYQVSFNLHAR